jgi:hypothetical protein
MEAASHEPGVRDLVLRAAADPEFARQLVTDPASFAAGYNLTPEHVEGIQKLAQQGLLDAVNAGTEEKASSLDAEAKGYS